MTPKELFSTCQVERHFKKRSGKLSQGSVAWEKTESVIGPCNAPLFGALETQTGICASCATGWTHRHNKPTDAGRKQIVDAVRQAWRSRGMPGTPLAEFDATAKSINALPEPLRSYIHDIETRCDPSGDVQTIAI